jgi:chitin synthase
MRYTAVVSDPNDFSKEGYVLRHLESGPPEIFVVITMYNEDQELFLKTWNAIHRNIQYLCSRKNSPVWKEESWRKVVVSIISDGRGKIHPKTLAILGLLGVYQEGMVTTSIENQAVTAHLFEYTTHVSLDSNFNLKKGNVNVVPIQVIFCLKEKNAKKINSHRWFFNAFCHQLSPFVCILIDVGTKPTDQSLYHLWKEFYDDPQVGGACGEVTPILTL